MIIIYAGIAFIVALIGAATRRAGRKPPFGSIRQQLPAAGVIAIVGSTALFAVKDTGAFHIVRDALIGYVAIAAGLLFGELVNLRRGKQLH